MDEDYRYRECKNLGPLTKNPNSRNIAMFNAIRCGATEIVKILAPLTKNPNTPLYDNFDDDSYSPGQTPIHMAACSGHVEIVKILAPLTDNPNAPDNDGDTPFSIAQNAEIRIILRSFNTSIKCKHRSLDKPSKKRAKNF